MTVFAQEEQEHQRPETIVWHSMVPVKEKQRKAVKRKEKTAKTTPFGVNLMRSQVLYRAARARF